MYKFHISIRIGAATWKKKFFSFSGYKVTLDGKFMLNLMKTYLPAVGNRFLVNKNVFFTAGWDILMIEFRIYTFGNHSLSFRYKYVWNFQNVRLNFAYTNVYDSNSLYTKKI